MATRDADATRTTRRDAIRSRRSRDARRCVSLHLDTSSLRASPTRSTPRRAPRVRVADHAAAPARSRAPASAPRAASCERIQPALAAPPRTRPRSSPLAVHRRASPGRDHAPRAAMHDRHRRQRRRAERSQDEIRLARRASTRDPPPARPTPAASRPAPRSPPPPRPRIRTRFSPRTRSRRRPTRRVVPSRAARVEARTRDTRRSRPS